MVMIAELLPLNVTAPVKVNAPLGEFPVMVAVAAPLVIISGVVAVALVMTRLATTISMAMVPFLVVSFFILKVPMLLNSPCTAYTNEVGENPAIVRLLLPLLLANK